MCCDPEITFSLFQREATMTTALATPQFDTLDILRIVDELSDDELDALEFGVIGIDKDGVVRRYNHFESKLAGLSRDRVIGSALFTVVAPCMNNFMVAQRFEDNRLRVHLAHEASQRQIATLGSPRIGTSLRACATRCLTANPRRVSYRY
jgi:photoactive yellow protein